MSARHKNRSRRGGAGRLFATIGAVFVLSAGCAQPVYRVADIPAEFAAPPAAALDTVNLARLASNANTSDVIAWGDLLAIEVDPGVASIEPREVQARVARDGTVGVPLVGRVGVAGLEVEQAEQAIAAAARLRDVYPNPFVSVRIAEPRTNQITVVGGVEKPGVYALPRGGSSLLAALVAAGGVGPSASGDVEIRHTDPRLAAPAVFQASDSAGTRLASHATDLSSPGQVVQVNLLAATAGGAHGGHALEDGDVVNVVKRDLPPIHVMGLVNKPGAFDISANREVRLLDALALAQGCSTQVADKVVIVRRLPEKGSSITIEASIEKAIAGPDNVLLAPGDTVVVRQTPATVVVDVLKNFLRFGVSGTVPLF